MNEPPKSRTVNLKGWLKSGTNIEFLYAELSPDGGPFALIRYAVNGVEEKLGLRLDLDKRVFLDHLSEFTQEEEARIIDELISYIASAITDKLLTEEELEVWINTHAKYSVSVRMARSRNDAALPQLTKEDIHYAEQALAYDILDGKINFVRRIAPPSYYRLEDVWLWEVKKVKAYLLWEERHGGINPQYEPMDYDKACEHIRGLLVNQVKGTIAEFQEPKAYLKKRYLSSDTELDEKKAENLIQLKADRIKDMTRETNPNDNLFNARMYVEGFYQNIIPAVETNNRDNILKVLEAFKFSKGPTHRFLVINCFEAALAIYFINPKIISTLWEERVISKEESL